MIEDKVKKTSLKVFILALFVCIIISVILRDFTYITGMALGYALSLAAFALTTSMTDLILTQSKRQSVMLAVMMFVGKLVIYAAGIVAGLFFPEYINYIAVFIGYFLIRIAIYYDAVKERRKKKSERNYL